MKKSSRLCYLLIAISSLLVAAGGALSADWVLVLENEEGSFYVDRDTAAKNTTSVKDARVLSVPKNHKEISRFLEHAEYDCGNTRRRVFQLMTHFRNGETSFSNSNNPPWEDIGGQAGSKALFQFICK